MVRRGIVPPETTAVSWAEGWQAVPMSDYRLWLAALPEPLAEADARVYWNLKDPTPALTEALAGAAYFYVGSWQEAHVSEHPRGAAQRCGCSTGCFCEAPSTAIRPPRWTRSCATN